MVDGNLAKKMLKHRRSTFLKWRRDFSLAEVTSDVTGKVWNYSDEESHEDEGDGTHAYLGMQFFNWGYLMGRTQMRKVSQACEGI